MIVSSLLAGFSYVLVGPSQIIPMNDSLMLMAIGQALIGIFLCFLIIPSLPEMVESQISRFPGQERQVNDLCSGLFNAFLGFGQGFAPIFGGFLYERVGWRLTSDVIGILCIVFALMYFCLAGGISAVKETYHRMKN